MGVSHWTSTSDRSSRSWVSYRVSHVFLNAELLPVDLIESREAGSHTPRKLPRWSFPLIFHHLRLKDNRLLHLNRLDNVDLVPKLSEVIPVPASPATKLLMASVAFNPARTDIDLLRRPVEMKLDVGVARDLVVTGTLQWIWYLSNRVMESHGFHVFPVFEPFDQRPDGKELCLAEERMVLVVLVACLRVEEDRVYSSAKEAEDVLKERRVCVDKVGAISAFPGGVVE